MSGTEFPAARAVFWTRLTLALLLVLFALWIAHGLLPALIWAVIIAIAFDPLYLRLRNGRGARLGPVACALIITTLIALMVLVPLAFGLTQAALEAQQLAAWITQATHQGLPLPEWVADLPVGARAATRWWHQNLSSPRAATATLHSVAGLDLVTHGRLLGTNLVHRAVIFAFTLFALFFLLRDRDRLIMQCRRAGDRIFGAAGERIAGQAIRSVRATIDGLVLVGLGEGAVMALVYYVLVVPHPILLGVLTAVAAMIPFGAALVFAIAALLLLIGQGSVAGAVMVIVAGMIEIGRAHV